MKMSSPFIFPVFSLIIILLLLQQKSVAAANLTNDSRNVYMGVVLDLSSSMDNMIDICLSIAVADFYEAHPHYATRLHLHTKNAEELDVNFAVLEMLQNGEVHGVLGPQWSKEATFVAELGARAHVPVISFTAKTRRFPHSQLSPYFVSTTPADMYQVKALAAICQGFEWDQVVVLYEDTEYGTGFVSELNKGFKTVDIRLASMVGISSSARDSEIKEELTGLMVKQTRVFVVHMNILLGQRLFALARKAGMMEKGYVWLITDILSNFLTSFDSSSMENVLGIRPYVPKSDSLDKFRAKWRRNALSRDAESHVMDLNVYGLLAYDTVWALAMAVEKARPQMADFLNSSQRGDINVKVSGFGQRVLTQLLNTKFSGLTGEFQLVDGQLQPLAFEIFNVIGSGDRTVGYWSPVRGISSEVSAEGSDLTYSTSTKELRVIMWPGDTLDPPKCWGIPTTGKLKVGVPKKEEFFEFIYMKEDPSTHEYNITGYSIDIFLASLDYLSEHENLKLDYEFVPYLNTSKDRSGSYTEMLHEMTRKTYDFVIGDISILASRSKFVAFTPPYTESGIVRVMKIRKSLDMWNFLKPLRWDLWLTFAAACIFIGGVLGVLEHQIPSKDTNPLAPAQEEHRLRFFFWLPIAVLAFPERNMVANKWSNFVLIIWLFVFNILMQSYTAKLSSIFTVDQLNFAFTRDCYVGYQSGTFVKSFLINELLFHESKLRNYTTIKQYHEAINLGSKKGGIDAIYGEIPYVKLIVNGHKSDYRIVEPTYQTGGLGFAFPEDSPLVKYFSRAILHVTQNQSIMTGIEKKNFGPGSNSDLDSINQENSSLTPYNFGGLFIIVIAATIFALFFSKTWIGQSLAAAMSNSGHRCSSFLIYGESRGRVHSFSEKESESSDEPSDDSKVNNPNEGIGTESSSVSEESDANGSRSEGEIQLT